MRQIAIRSLGGLCIVVASVAACSAGVDGDIIFQTSLLSQSVAIQRATHSKYSHMGLIVVRDGAPYVLEASATVRYTPLKTWIAIFYPVTNQAYARQIARDWNVKASGAGFVTRFAVDAAYLSRFPVETVGGAVHTEYWIPAEELPEFNDHIVGLIEVIEEFRAAI